MHQMALYRELAFRRKKHVSVKIHCSFDKRLEDAGEEIFQAL